jgi:hypothetical protein
MGDDGGGRSLKELVDKEDQPDHGHIQHREDNGEQHLYPPLAAQFTVGAHIPPLKEKSSDDCDGREQAQERCQELGVYHPAQDSGGAALKVLRARFGQILRAGIA